MKAELERTKALTFDLFGTVLDLGGSLTPYIAEFLTEQGHDKDPGEFWDQLRYRQRLEQYQDSLVDLGHSGYLETVERAFSYVCRLNGLDPERHAIKSWMESWQMLSAFPEVTAALDRLRSRFALVALSTETGGSWIILSRIGSSTTSMQFSQWISLAPSSPILASTGGRRGNSTWNRTD